LALLLRQEPVTILDDGLLQRTLNFGGQSAFTVKALALWRASRLMANQPVEGVVAILA
jgi:hypothetical protein